MQKSIFWPAARPDMGLSGGSVPGANLQTPGPEGAGRKNPDKTPRCLGQRPTAIRTFLDLRPKKYPDTKAQNRGRLSASLL